VATGFFQKKLAQEGPPTLATALLQAFPDPQEALFQSPEGQALHREGRTEAGGSGRAHTAEKSL
jgi:hypothetical protein